MSPPLREPLSQRGGWAGTRHFTVLAAGPGAFRAIVQRWELAAAQLNSWCCLTPCKWLTSHDLTAKGALQRAAVHVRGWWLWRVSPGHFLATSPDCNGCVLHKGQQRQRWPIAHRLRRTGERAPSDLPLTHLCLLLSQTGLGADPGPG